MPVISFLPFLQGIPYGTRILTSLLVAASLGAWFLSAYLELRHDGVVGAGRTGAARFAVDVAPWLVIYPGRSWVYPWTLVTAPWIEGNLLEVSGVEGCGKSLGSGIAG
jgi:hypothetical protein